MTVSRARLDAIRERAENATATLDSGSEPWADSGYGYEHMGDMARDLEPLAREDIPWLLAELERVTAALQDIAHGPYDHMAVHIARSALAVVARAAHEEAE